MAKVPQIQPKLHLLTAVFMLCLIAGSAHAEKLRLGNEGVYPPFSMVSADGRLTGIEPDLAREMCRRMKVDCEFVVMDFKALIPSLLQGKLDAVVSQITPLPQRKARALFTVPVVYNPQTFVVAAGSQLRFTKVGLSGLRIGVERGSDSLIFIRDLYGDSVNIVTYDSPDQIRLDLISGRIDMAFGPKMYWAINLISSPQGGAWKLAGGDHWVGDLSTVEADRGLSWITRKSRKGQILVKRMNDALESMIADCTFSRIRANYLKTIILPSENACALVRR